MIKVSHCIFRTSKLRLSNYYRSGFRLYSSGKLNAADPAFKIYLNKLLIEYKELSSRASSDAKSRYRLTRIASTALILEEKKQLEDNIASLKEIESVKDEEMMKLAQEESELYSNQLLKLNEKIIESLLSEDGDFTENTIIVEIVPGVGGQEAMLFTSELFHMYLGLAGYNNWSVIYADIEKTDLGGIRRATLMVKGVGVKAVMMLESGSHRVQRVPITEKGGRMHTSTAVVAILPVPTEFEINISMKDLKIETKRASGAGGQHVNTTESAIRITHLPTGVVAESQENRSQIKNRETAMQKIRSRILKRMQDEEDSQIKSERKSQVGSGERNEKIRTYNYQQDRVTDHRLSAGGTVKNLPVVMMGGPALASIQRKLKQHQRMQRLLDDINFSVDK